MEPHRRLGDGDPRVHRLPASHGAVLRPHVRLAHPDVDRPAVLARLHPLHRGNRHPLPVPHDAASRSRSRGRRTGVHALAVLLAVRQPDLGDPAAVGGTALHAGVRHPGSSTGRVALAGPVRADRCLGQRHQRDGHHLRGGRAGSLADLRRRRAARGDVAPRHRHRAAYRHLDPRCLLVVDGGSLRRSRLRRQRPQVHRDRPVHLGHLEPLGGDPRHRLLVLLRRRQPRAVEQFGGPLHPEPRPLGHVVRRSGFLAGGCRLHPLARAGLLHRLDLCRARPLRRPVPLHQPDGDRAAVQVLHDQHDGRPGHALDRPRHATGAPRPRHAARRRRHRALGAHHHPRARLGVPPGCPRRRQQPFDLQRRHDSQLPLDPRCSPLLRAAGHHPSEQHAPGHARPGHPRGQLRLVPLGRSPRHAAAGIPHQRLRHPRATGDGLHRNRRHPLRARRPHSGELRELQRTGADGPADECRGPHGGIRPALRALRRAPAQLVGPPAVEHAHRPERSRVLWCTKAEHLRRVHAERTGPRARLPPCRGRVPWSPTR